MSDKTRLEMAHHDMHRKIAKLVSPPYKGTPEEYERIRPIVDQLHQEFGKELLVNERETIEFFAA